MDCMTRSRSLSRGKQADEEAGRSNTRSVPDPIAFRKVHSDQGRAPSDSAALWEGGCHSRSIDSNGGSYACALVWSRECTSRGELTTLPILLRLSHHPPGFVYGSPRRTRCRAVERLVHHGLHSADGPSLAGADPSPCNSELTVVDVACPAVWRAHPRHGLARDIRDQQAAAKQTDLAVESSQVRPCPDHLSRDATRLQPSAWFANPWFR